MAKATITRPKRDAIPAKPEHKVPGEIYRPEQAGMIADPGEVTLTMSVDEAHKVKAILGHGVCNSGGVKTPYDVWDALCAILPRREYIMHNWEGNTNGGWPYLVRNT